MDAPSVRRLRMTKAAAVSRTSPVSFLKAKPNMAIRFPAMVLNMVRSMMREKRFFWKSFMTTTWFQYSATSGNPNDSHKYTKLRISFWKQDPPKPTEACKNLLPIRGSVPTARATSATFAAVASQRAEIELILDTRCAKNALATSLDSSEDHKLVVMIDSRGTQRAYTSTRRAMAAAPASDSSAPINTRPGFSRSRIAVPSAKNSGLLRIWKLSPRELACSTRRMVLAVCTGTVDFSTTILSDCATSAILRAHSSQFLMFAARPAPMPDVFVGVFTDTKIMSAAWISASISVEKNRLRPRVS
mmetsp:Transcript_2147/g.3966  ORF Transcript_2147/g.3966 Transcript_2147/m.3966 type:complete len:302 (-) Transcript_2147:241-1146(-)